MRASLTDAGQKVSPILCLGSGGNKVRHKLLKKENGFACMLCLSAEHKEDPWCYQWRETSMRMKAGSGKLPLTASIGVTTYDHTTMERAG
jgi:hypothetical protein